MRALRSSRTTAISDLAGAAPPFRSSRRSGRRPGRPSGRRAVISAAAALLLLGAAAALSPAAPTNAGAMMTPPPSEIGPGTSTTLPKVTTPPPAPIPLDPRCTPLKVELTSLFDRNAIDGYGAPVGRADGLVEVVLFIDGPQGSYRQITGVSPAFNRRASSIGPIVLYNGCTRFGQHFSISTRYLDGRPRADEGERYDITVFPGDPSNCSQTVGDTVLGCRATSGTPQSTSPTTALNS